MIKLSITASRNHLHFLKNAHIIRETHRTSTQLHTVCSLSGLLHFSVTEHVLTCSLLVVFAPVEGAVAPLAVELFYSFCGYTYAGAVAEAK